MKRDVLESGRNSGRYGERSGPKSSRVSGRWILGREAVRVIYGSRGLVTGFDSPVHRPPRPYL